MIWVTVTDMVVVTEHSDVPEVMMFLAADEVLFQHEQ